MLLPGVLAAVLLLAGVVPLDVAGEPSAAARAETRSELRVGSFNVLGVTFDTAATGEARPWRERRAVVARQIVEERLDVVGVQEANPSGIYGDRLVSGRTQFLDLRDALSAQGGRYALTTTAAYNCARSTSSHKCRYRNRGSALSNRIYYRVDTLALVRKGATKYSRQTPGTYERYFEWAVFEVKATGKRFLFTNTHIDPYNNAVKAAQWKQSIALTNRQRRSLPVVAVGDYNSTKFSAWSKQMLPAMRRAGYGDVLNQEFQVNPVRSRRADKATNAFLNSFNRFNRRVTWCYCDQREKYGNNIDWIFASNKLQVREWKVVADIAWNTMQLRGIIPSDHNLVRATLVL